MIQPPSHCCESTVRSIRRGWPSCRCTADRQALADRLGITLRQLNQVAVAWGLR